MPENTRAELRRHLARLRVREQIRAIEYSRLGKLATTPEKGPPAMVRLIARLNRRSQDRHTVANPTLARYLDKAACT